MFGKVNEQVIPAQSLRFPEDVAGLCNRFTFLTTKNFYFFYQQKEGRTAKTVEWPIHFSLIMCE